MSSQIKFLQQREVQEFIRRNDTSDPHKLLLNPPSAFKEHIALIVDQLISRKKAKTKLHEWYTNEQLIMPPPLSLEQCSSPPTAAYKRNLIKGNTLIDLTGGMGIDTLHLADNFDHTTYVERDEWLCEVFAHNRSLLTSKQLDTVNTSAETFLSEFSGQAYFFIDPARRDSDKKQVFHFENCAPNIMELMPAFQQKAKQVLIKAAPMIDITLGIQQLQFVKAVHIVSVKNEMKEVLFLLDFQELADEPTVHCVNLLSDHPHFSFNQSQERTTDVIYSSPKKFLYDPNSSLLKAGAFKQVARQYSLGKLSPNTHLYTSDELHDRFPGRIFEIQHDEVSKKNIKQLIPGGKANVITKNHPQKPEELKRKFKLKDGGDQFLIGYLDMDKKPQLNLCSRIK